MSHDRAFVDRICERLLVLPRQRTGELRVWEGSFTAYLEWRDTQPEEQRCAAPAPVASPPPAIAPPPPSKKKTSDKNVQWKLQKIEKDMGALQAKVDKLQSQVDTFDASTGDYEELNKWHEELGKAVTDLEKKEEEWIAVQE